MDSSLAAVRASTARSAWPTDSYSRAASSRPSTSARRIADSSASSVARRSTSAAPMPIAAPATCLDVAGATPCDAGTASGVSSAAMADRIAAAVGLSRSAVESLAKGETNG